jgi:DNA-binding MarR family transcriptional regulator
MMSQILQALRLKGRATAEELATSLGVDPGEVTTELVTLADEKLVVERTSGRRPGWMLTGDGRERYDASLADARTPEVVERLTETYASFLQHNQPVKDLCARWQGTSDDALRFGIIEDLGDIGDKVAPSLTSAGEVVPRFGAYAHRLTASLDKAADDHRFVVSPTVDSFHTVWFECHEDYLLMLGRSREQEGSW